METSCRVDKSQASDRECGSHRDSSGRCVSVCAEDATSRNFFATAAIDPRELLRAAVKSLDPQVLDTIGRVQLLLNLSNPDSNIEYFAWTYVACQRGLNCSPTSHWAQDCPNNCNASTPASVMMGWSGSDWPAVQQRADEINAKLDAGQWDELGLGP
jgi:hypothetical protein